MERRINDLRKQIMLTSWDIPLIQNEETKTLKLQKLDSLKRELNELNNR